MEGSESFTYRCVGGNKGISSLCKMFPNSLLTTSKFSVVGVFRAFAAIMRIPAPVHIRKEAAGGRGSAVSTCLRVSSSWRPTNTVFH